MSTPLLQRTHYFTGEALLTDDFLCEQQYHMKIQALNNQSLYTYGIANGLDVFWDSANTTDQVRVGAGMALDSLGRQIVLLQAQVVRFTGITPGTHYFLTIRYNEVYADYTDQPTGVAGYKRIVDQPSIRYVRNLEEPGLNIVLAVIAFTHEGTIDQLTYRSGAVARHYVSSTLGALTLLTEGAGVRGNPVPGTLRNTVDANDSARYPRLSARQQAGASEVYLEVEASRAQFMGVVNTRNNLGIGNPQPLANLQIDAITFKGAGALTSTGAQVKFSAPVSPFFQLGDVLISDPPVTTLANGTTSFGVSQRRTVQSVDSASQVTVDRAFEPALNQISYSYIRSTLARFSVGADDSLLAINIDGSVGLGRQASANAGLQSAGRHTLTVSPDRRVGIALVDREPGATLDVNGAIRTDDLTVSGQLQTDTLLVSRSVRAQSFEGNGSKLQGLPILSYWTRETIGTPQSNLYYNDGNVGIRDKSPIGSLSVGGGQPFVGTGLVTSLSESVLQGYQTEFERQVSLGDTITIGMLVEQTGIISEIVSKTKLLVQDQLPVVVSNSSYKYGSPDGAAAQPAKGTISTNGTTVDGTDTDFLSACAVGGRIVIDRFFAANSVSQQSAVQSVTNDTQMTIASAFAVDLKDSPYSYAKGNDKPVGGAGTISTAGTQVSGTGTAFNTFKDGGYTIVIPNNSTLPQTMRVQSIDSRNRLTLSQDSGQPLPNDAMLNAATSAYVVTPSILAYVAANAADSVLGPTAMVPPALIVTTNSKIDNPNTVAINVPLDQVQDKYALQVAGNINASGFSLDVDSLEVKRLTATVSATIDGDGSASASALLTVRENGGPDLLVVDKQTVKVAGLESAGTLHAKGDIVGDTTVQAGLLDGKALQVAGTQIDTAGRVQIIGTRTAYDQSALTDDGTLFSRPAHTDGYVMATVGQPTWNASYCGTLAGTTYSADGTPTSFVYATALAYQYTVRGKKSAKTISIPVPGAFTMPVKKGETWELKLTWVKDIGGAPNVEFYWIPLGSGPAQNAAMESAAPSAPGGGGMAAQLQQVRDDLASGRIAANVVQDAQQVIEQRMGDLTQVFGDAIQMSSNPQDRARFVAQLGKIVCAPGAGERTSTSPGFEANLAALIDVFEQSVGRTFAPGERGLLADGVRALVRINDNEASRQDLNLIRNNIDLFIDNVQQAMHVPIDANQRRILTRALVRLVGDGSGS